VTIVPDQGMGIDTERMFSLLILMP
jgi:hypothetical protein